LRISLIITPAATSAWSVNKNRNTRSDILYSLVYEKGAE
jgi:hypothetical protein